MKKLSSLHLLSNLLNDLKVENNNSFCLIFFCQITEISSSVNMLLVIEPGEGTGDPGPLKIFYFVHIGFMLVCFCNLQLVDSNLMFPEEYSRKCQIHMYVHGYTHT